VNGTTTGFSPPTVIAIEPPMPRPSPSAASPVGCRCISIDEPEAWTAALATVPHAFGHTWAYCRAMQMSCGLPTLLLEISTPEGPVLCPFHDREFAGSRDLVTPPGFSGFIGAVTSPSFPRAWRAFVDRDRYVCSYVGLHPALTSPAAFPVDDVFPAQSVFILDLTRPEDELYRSLDANRRREVRREPLRRFDRETLARFVVMHHETFMTKRRAGAAARLPRAALEHLLVDERVCMLGDGFDDLDAVVVCGSTPWVGDYLFGVFSDRGRSLSGSLIWRAAMQLRQQGVRQLHLGGGVSHADGVTEFKRRFGGLEQPMFAIKQIHDADAYRRLCAAIGAPDTNRAGYFPAYWRGRP
jgi:hypothetical protein